MKAKTFLGKLKVTIGEYENMVTLLLVAPSEEQAHVLLDEAARSYYGGDEGEDSESTQYQHSYSSNGGEVAVEPAALKEIGLSTFLDLQACFMVQRHATVKMPNLEDLEALKPAAKALHTGLVRKQIECTHLEVLDALASSWGANSWQVLKERQGSSSSDTWLSNSLATQLVDAAQQVCDNSSSEGCTDDLVVTSLSAVSALESVLRHLPVSMRTAKSTQQSPGVRTDVVEEVVSDVRHRARKYEFAVTSLQHAKELAQESAELLDHTLSEEELAHAATLLY